jgi:hypothetical protein
LINLCHLFCFFTGVQSCFGCHYCMILGSNLSVAFMPFVFINLLR